MNKKIVLLLAAAILTLGLALRFVQLGAVPVSLYWDEMAILVDAKSIAQTGRDVHGRPWLQTIFPSYGDYKLPVYIWLASVSVGLFGVNEWALRMPSALAGVGTILVGGAIAFELGRGYLKTQSSRQVFALASMLVIAISPWSVMFSRTGFEGHVAQFLVSLSVWLLLVSEKKRWMMVVAALVGGLATYGYFSVRFVWPVVFAAYLLLIGYQPVWQAFVKKNWKGILVAMLPIALGLGVFGLCLVPMTKSPLYQDSNRFRLSTDSVLTNDKEVIQSNIYREQAGNTSIDRVVFHRYWLTTQKLLENYADHLSLSYMFMDGDENLRHGTGQHGLFLLFFLPFFLVGLYSLFHQQKRLFSFLVIWWLIALLPASVPENTPHALRSLNALMPLALIIAWGVTVVIHWLSRVKIALKAKYAIIVVAITLLGFNLVEFSYYYFLIYPKTSADSWQQGYREISQAIFKLREDKPTYIEGVDDKLYLWLMGYGPYTGNEFASWETKQYQHKTFDHIYFSVFPGWENVERWDTKVVVAGTPEDIKKVIDSQPMRLVDSIFIYDPDGDAKYVVVLVEKKL